MFPWVCLATMPLFYPFDWPKTIISFANYCYTQLKQNIDKKVTECKIIPICRTIHPVLRNEDKSTEIIGKESSNNQETKKSEANTDQGEKTDDNDEKLNPKDEIHQEKDQNGLEETNSLVNDETDTRTDTGTDFNDVECKKKRRTMYLIALYVFVQAFLPYSHFITKVR